MRELRPTVTAPEELGISGRFVPDVSQGDRSLVVRLSSRAVVMAGLLLPLLACNESNRSPARSGTLAYTENAKRSFEDAMKLYKEKEWLEAGNAFRELRRKFSFSGFSPLAQLRLADIEYDQEKWIEAISAYKAFLRENPKHTEIGWARMRVARSYYNQIGDSALLPSQEERDQSAVVEAAREIKNYLEEFPSGPEFDKMKVIGADALARLVAHELYVARFYVDKGKLEPALARTTYAVTKYRGSSKDVEALLLQGEILMMLKRPTDARATFRYVLAKFASDPRAAQAKRFLLKLGD